MVNKEIFLYVDKAFKDPDRVDGLVPFRVSDKYIFFGPGQTAFRKALRKRFLKYKNSVVPETEIHLVGVSDVSKSGIRKVVWMGHMVRVMTFVEAFGLLEDPEFASLINVEIKGQPGKNMSPLHIEPMGIMGNLSGYRHRSSFHDKIDKDGIPEWVKDVMDPRDKDAFMIKPDEIMLEDLSQRSKVLTRDCCMLCGNEFFADGKGIEIGGEMVTVLDEWQPGQGVDSVGIFGYSQGRDGKKTMNKASTMPLHIRWNAAERLLEYLYRERG
jgi:hypothetical protein